MVFGFVEARVDPSMNSAYLQEVISIHRDDIASCKRRGFLLTTGGVGILVFSGVTWILVARGVIGSNLIPALISTIGVFVSVFGFLPYKDVTQGKFALARLNEVSREYERIKDLPEDERERRLSNLNKVLSEFK